MSNYPNSIDNDSSLPRADDGVTEFSSVPTNAARDAIFAIENTLGVNPQGSRNSVADRLNQSLDQGGNILPSSLAGLGLVYLPINDSEISPTAAIQESKLKLTYSTSSLFNLYLQLNNAISVLNGFLSLTGVKVEPHINGSDYNHNLSAILVDPATLMYKALQVPGQAAPGTSVELRNTTNADTLVKDISDDLLTHEKADGQPNDGITSGGTVPPENFSHVSAGVWLNPSSFSTIPQTTNNVQSFAEFVDSSSNLLIGTRIQTLFADGIPRDSRSSVLPYDGYGQSIVPITSVVAYLLDVPPGPQSTAPIDNINNGDDVILFTPSSQQLSTSGFDAQFSQVKPGDLLTINYGNGVAAQFIVESKKSIISGLNRTYAVRINGKNLFSSANASARIDRPLFNTNKYGVLAAARAPNSTGVLESLIIANPRAAIVLGNGFNPSQFNSTHYNLYLALFPTGDPLNPQPQSPFLPAIDVTGNKGATPGQYTLRTIIDATNTAFRAAGYNFRFVAFEYQGQFGIMLADPYNNASFSIISGAVDANGNYTSSSLAAFPGCVVDNFNGIDPLGIGLTGSNVASPSPALSYANPIAANVAPTLIFPPLTKNYFYVDGVERDRLKSDPLVINDISDAFGDGYWPATILPPPATQIFASRVQVAYQVNLDLSDSGLFAGKTIVIQPAFALNDPRYNFRDYGRFIISSVAFNGCGTANPQTIITVYDGVHAAGTSPAVTSTNIPVNIYFSDDSVSFNKENVFDQNATLPYKRFFEIYINKTGHTFSHERARFSNGVSSICNINFYDVSPKLFGYPTNNNDREIRLTISNYDSTTGIFTGFLARWNPGSSTTTNFGPTITGKKGEIVRFYDQSNIDYIDFTIDINTAIGSFASQTLDIQLFPTLQLNGESMLVSTCQVNDTTLQVSYLKDKRQFGNISERQLSDSAIDFISASDRMLSTNGVIRGFNVVSTNTNIISLTGGTVLVNGKFVNINPESVSIPPVNETYLSTTYNINWALCVDNNKFILIPLTDFDTVLGTPNAPTRIVTILNPANTDTYPVDSSTFSNLINNRKDLAVLYVVSATVTGSGSSVVTSLVVSDARKFINDSNSVLPITWTSDSAQGNFETLSSILTWLKFNSSFNNTVKLRGAFTVSSATALDFSQLSSPVKFIGDSAIINVTSRIGFTLGSNVSFDGIVFNYNYNPVGDGFYSSSDLVNSGGGLFHCSMSANKNISITNCIFNATLPDRYSFINFESLVFNTSASNINISNNIFNSTASTDVRAVISFISNPSGPTTATSFQKLKSVVIANNICNSDSMIIVSATRHVLSGNSIINTNCLVCQNVVIRENNCGTIGFITQQGIAVIENVDRFNGLLIDKNTCKYIASLDYRGGFIAFAVLGSPPDFVTISTGDVAITNNTASWIHSGVSGVSTTPKTSLIISNNKLFGNTTSFLSVFTDTLNSPTNVGDNVAIIVNAQASPVDGATVISGNVVSKGQIYSGGVLTSYTYLAYIDAFDSATITNNRLYGVGITPQVLVYFQGLSGLIQGNVITRGTATVASFIGGPGTSLTSHAVVTNNYFDSTTIDGSAPNIGTGIPTTWVFKENKNQVAIEAIPFTSNMLATTGNVVYFNSGDGMTLTTFGGISGLQSSAYLGVRDTATNTQRVVNKSVDLNLNLPRNVIIQSLEYGFFISAGNVGTGVNLAGLQILADDDSPGTFVADVKTYSGLNPSSITAATPVAITTSVSTQFVTISSVPAVFTTGQQYRVTALLFMEISSNGSLVMGVSPLVVTYHW